MYNLKIRRCFEEETRHRELRCSLSSAGEDRGRGDLLMMFLEVCVLPLVLTRIRSPGRQPQKVYALKTDLQRLLTGSVFLSLWMPSVKCLSDICIILITAVCSHPCPHPSRSPSSRLPSLTLLPPPAESCSFEGKTNT